MENRKILIIDDEKNIRITLGACLESAGYLVATAVNGEEGLEKTDQDQYDLIFLDMKMPGMDGLTVLRNLKDHSPALNVVMMTAYGTIETAVEAMKLGAVDYLRKPFSPDEVKELTETIFKREMLNTSTVSDYQSLVEYAKSLIIKKDFNQGEEWLRKAIALDPTKPEAFNLLGVMMEMETDLQQAQKMYRAALSLNPTYTPAIENLHRTAKWEYTQEGMNLGDRT